jgi:hypothetical protein
VCVGGFLDVGADEGERQQVDIAGLQPGLSRCLEGGSGGQAGEQDTVVGDDAFLKPVHAAQQPCGNAQGRAVLAQPVLDGLAGLAFATQLRRALLGEAVA